MTDTFDRLQSALSDRYAVERELGSGGMATVYLAEDLKHRRKVAVKVLRPELAAALGPERFLREIEIAASLTHPHILPVHDSGEADGFLYYVMPYVEGESLRHRLHREKQLPADDALQIAREVADALGFAHTHDVIHRDIKPENILLQAGHAVVVDFGIARALDIAGGTRLTETGMALGTPQYMSPEQAAGSGEVDGRSDIYALGCVLYEMLGGQPPFTGATVESVVHQHLAAAPPRVTQLRPTVPDEVVDLLTKALAKAPADRFPTAGAFAAALRQEGAGQPPGSAALAARFGSPFYVAGLFGALALVVLAVVYALVRLLGLPDWVFVSAVALVVLALPVTLLTGHVERRRAVAHSRGTPAPGRGVHRWLGWRRTLVGGGVALGGLGVVTALYMAMRALGIGPVGTLMATGVLDERDPIVLADFTDHAGDSTLALALTEAIRVDLAQSPVVTLLTSEDMAAALRRMGQKADRRFDLAVARELAIREGLKAVIAGEINAAGTGYLLSVQVVSAETGEVLTALRETASDSTQIIGAIDRVSARLRARIGESLRTIRRSPPLSQVTTSSLAALRKYSAALTADIEGRRDRAIMLLEEAVAVDTAFAMAYRKLGILLGNRAIERARVVEALTRAFEHRDRLTEHEQYLAMAAYYGNVTGEREDAMAAYRALLELFPNETTALNNLGTMLRDRTQALALYRRAAHIDSTNVLFITNVAEALTTLGRLDEADSALRVAARRFPNDRYVAERRAQLAYARKDYDGGIAVIDSLWRAVESPYLQLRATMILALVHGVRGRVGESDLRFKQAGELFESAGLGSEYVGRAARRAVYDVYVRNDPDQAIQRVQTVLERFPLQSIHPVERPYVALAEFYAVVGKTDRAKRLLAEYEVEVDPGLRRRFEADRRRALGFIALAEGRAHDAVAEFKRSDAEDTCPICALPGLALAYEHAGERDSALAVYERYVTTGYTVRAVQDFLWLPHTYRRLGELYEERGNIEKATNYYNELIELWEDADEELQPQVREIRRRLMRLVGEPG